MELAVCIDAVAGFCWKYL